MSIASAPIRALLVLLAVTLSAVLHAQPKTCQRVQFTGEVAAGAEWRASIGQGWVFRVVPIHGYSGWDLVVDQEPAAGYPDALLLATPPYNSLNEREIGATLGLRAQDALGWNPRSFRFMTNASAFRGAQQFFLNLERSGELAHPNSAQLAKFLGLQQHSAAGEFRILDARLTPGIVDPQPFAQNWVRAFSQTSYTIQPPPDGRSTPAGTLNWMRFNLLLTLPANWKFPPSVHADQLPCSQ